MGTLSRSDKDVLTSSAVFSEGSKGYATSKRRWLMLLLFSVGTMQASVFQYTFAPISNIVAEYFDVSSAAVNMLTIFYLLAFPTLTTCTSITMGLYGLRKTVLIGAILEALSGWLRLGGCFNSSTFWLVAIGQIVGAFGQPFIGLNVVTLLSENWFPAGQERALSTTVSSLCAVVGGGVVFGLAPAIVMKGSDLWILMLVEAVVVNVLLGLILIFFDERPPTPPSAAAAASIEVQAGFHTRAEGQEISRVILGAFKELCQDAASAFARLNYLILYIAYGFMYGGFTALLTLSNEILVPEGYDALIAGLVGVTVIGCGVVGAVFASGFLGRFHAYRTCFCICTTGSLVALVSFAATLFFASEQLWLIFVTLGAFGLFAMAMVPAALEVAVEFTYPTPPGTSTGFLNIVGALTAVVLIFLLDSLQGVAIFNAAEVKDTDQMHLAVAILCALWFITAGTPLCMTSEYLRLNFERLPAEVVAEGGRHEDV